MKCVGESEKRINYGAYQSLCAIELKKLFGAAAIHWPKRIEYMFAHRRLTISIIRNIKTTNAHICLSYFRFSSIFHFVFVQFYWRLLNVAAYPLRCNRRALFIYILYSILYFVVVFFSRRIVGNFIRQCFVRCCVCYINTAIGPISPIICLYAVGISLYVAVVAVLFAFSIVLKNIFSVECKRLVSFIRYAQFFSLFLLSYAPEYYGDNFFL